MSAEQARRDERRDELHGDRAREPGAAPPDLDRTAILTPDEASGARVPAGAGAPPPTPPVIHDGPSGSDVRPVPPEATRTIGRYVVSAELGRGGMGVVFRAFDTDQRIPVAIKMVTDPLVAGEDNLKRFQREAQAAMRLRHPGIVAVHEIGEHEGHPYLVMDLVEGESFEALLRRGRVAPRRIAEIVRDVALALDYAHQKNVVHRDVKPENVLMDGGGRPRLADFGLARDLEEDEHLTVSGTILGTPSYMAPEQAGGDTRAQGPHCDIYSLGAVLYRALVGRPPFTAASFTALMKKVLLEEPFPPRKINASIHPDLEEIVLRCLSKDPSSRYATAAEVAEELRRFLDGEPITSRYVGPLDRAIFWRRRHPWLAAGLVVAVLTGVIGGDRAVAVVREQQRLATERSRHATCEALVSRGFDLYARNDLLGALETFQEATEQDAKVVTAWLGCGLAQHRLFDQDGALRDLTRALALDNRNPDIWVARGDANAEKGEKDAAIADYSRAIALDATATDAWYGRARARAVKGDRDRAMDDARAGLRLIPKGDPRRDRLEGLLRGLTFGR